MPSATDLFAMFRQAPSSPAAPTAKPSSDTRSGINPSPDNTPNPDLNSANPNPDPKQPKKDESPLAEFADLWKNEQLKEGEKPPTDWNDPNSVVPEVKLDSKKIYEAAQRIDFAKLMNPEKVAAALKGDAQAFGEVINTVMHHAYANAAISSSRISEALMKQMAPKLFEALPTHVRKHMLNDTVETDNPLFKDPAAAPLLESLKAQMQVKYPKATAKELSAMAKKYLENFVSTARGEKPGQPVVQQTNRNAVQKEDDWSEFLAPTIQQ